MHRYFGDQWSYGLINSYATPVTLVFCVFLYFLKKDSISLYSEKLLYVLDKKNIKSKNIVKVVLVCAELLLTTRLTTLSSNVNRAFGELVGTGANYFGLLIVAPIAWFIISLIIQSNLLRLADIVTLTLPPFLFVVKIACYCQGCCWGIPWEHGPYNHHIDHPGNQVPVQAIEAALAILILFFLFFIRKKTKPGQLYPAYLIAYSATRFPVEFLSEAHEKILGPFNTYHFLCIAGVAIGIIMLIIVKLFGDRMMEFFEKPHRKLEEKENALKCLEEKSMEDNEIARKEKIKLSREKAKARRKK